jgi:phage repressor protein C with HTH and peptisase S24 domain
LGEQDVVYRRLPPAKNEEKINENVRPTVRPTPILTPQYITVDNQGRDNILHISARAAAGYLSGHNNPVYLQQQPTFRLPGLTDASYRSFQVDGDSMNPTLLNGEMVIGRWVEKIEYIRDDRVHILVTKNDGVIIKRLLNRVNQYNKVIAKSDATNDRNLYPNIEVSPEDILEIWYAVFHGGFNFQSPTDMWKRVNNHEADITILQNTVDQLTNVIKSAGLLKE